LAAYSAISYDPATELKLATSINVDKNIPLATGPVNCISDSLIRTPEVSTVYYCGQDGGRYAFQNEGVYFSWYKDFSAVKVISTAEMGAIKLRGVVTYKPGTYLIKIQSSPKVYAISHGGVLHWVSSSDIGVSLYGAKWATKVRDIPESLFPAYKVGTDISRG